MSTPITDVWNFLTANTSDYLALGTWRFLVLALFYALLIASVLIAVRNWQEDPGQRTGYHVSLWLLRALLACMWFEAMLWKLPLPASPGLQYWTEQEATRAAFEMHRDLIRNVVLPHLALVGPFVFLAELAFSTSLFLGLAVRAAGVVAIVFVLQLWLGIYLPGEPAEWSWSYIFLAVLMLLLALDAAGRSLGLDAWLRRHVAAVRDGRGFWGRLLHLAG
jgi:hypothetical protein